MATAVMSVHTQTDETFEIKYDDTFRDTRVYLECPYHEKEQVKELGARWDTDKRLWYAPSGTNLTPLIPWMTLRTYLRCDNVEDKHAVESLGGKYDTERCQYYVIDSMEREPFARWL